MRRTLEDDLFDPSQWAEYYVWSEVADAAVEVIYPSPLKRNLLDVLDCAISIIHRRPELIAQSGMVETRSGAQSFDVACADACRLSPVALLERIVLYRFVRQAPFRFFYAGVVRHVMHRWLYRLTFELCDADTARIDAAVHIGEVLDWQNVIRPSPAEVAEFLVRVRGCLSRIDALSVMREVFGEEFAVPLRPSASELSLPHVYLPPERDV